MAVALSIALHGLVLAGASLWIADQAAPAERVDDAVLRLDLRRAAAEREPIRVAVEVREPIPEELDLPPEAAEPLDREAWSDPSLATVEAPIPRAISGDVEPLATGGARRVTVPRLNRRSSGVGLAASGASPGSDGDGSSGVGTPGAGAQAGGTPDGIGSGPGDRLVARAIVMPHPEYPESARRRREEGVVECRIHVRADGSVESVELRMSSGSDRLDRAAVAALELWRFEPATRRGEPVPSVVDQQVRFALRH